MENMCTPEGKKAKMYWAKTNELVSVLKHNSFKQKINYIPQYNNKDCSITSKAGLCLLSLQIKHWHRQFTFGQSKHSRIHFFGLLQPCLQRALVWTMQPKYNSTSSIALAILRALSWSTTWNLLLCNVTLIGHDSHRYRNPVRAKMSVSCFMSVEKPVATTWILYKPQRYEIRLPHTDITAFMAYFQQAINTSDAELFRC